MAGAFLSLSTISAGASTGIFGVWATQKNNGRVLIQPCGDAICGALIDANQLRTNPDQTDVHNPDPQQRARHLKGVLLLTGYRGGPSEWEGGTVYDPQTGDQSSDSTLTLVAPDTLKVEGCRFLFCRSETWTRLN